METVIRIVIFITKNKRYCNEISNIPIHMHKFSYRIVTSTEDDKIWSLLGLP